MVQRLVFAGLAVALLLACKSKDYAAIVHKHIQDALGEDPKGYHFFSYPTDNFGVGTAYRVPTPDEQPNDSNFLCATDKCLGLSSPGDKGLTKFVSIGQGGAIKFNEEEAKALSASLVMPAIQNVIGASAAGDLKKSVKTNLEIGKAFKRQLDREAFAKYIIGLPSSSLLKKGYNKGVLAVVVADVMVDALTVSVCVDQKVDTKVEAALKGKVGSVVGGDNGLKLAVSEGSAGCYSLAAMSPVIVAVLVKRQPAAETLAKGGFEKWDAAKKIDLPRPPSWWPVADGG